MSVPLFRGSSLKKIMAAMLSIDARGWGEEAAGSISEEVGCCVSSTLPMQVPHGGCYGCYLHTAREAMEARGCPICLCQARPSITPTFQDPFDRLYFWMLHSNEVPTAGFFTSCKEGFLIQAVHAPEGRENCSASMTCYKLLLPQP